MAAAGDGYDALLEVVAVAYEFVASLLGGDGGFVEGVVVAAVAESF